MIKRYAVAAALLSIITGGIVFSTGWGTALHIALGVSLAALMLAVAVRERSKLAWAAFALIAIEGCLFTSAVSVLHAFLAQLIFAVTVVIAGSLGKCPPEATSLRRFTLAIPPLVLFQTSLGALYRHKLTGVLPHMGGALLVVLLSLLVSMILLQRLTQPSPARSAAVALISIIMLQITLGIAAFLMRLLDTDQTPIFAWVSVAHLTNGALTLGASIILAMQVWWVDGQSL